MMQIPHGREKWEAMMDAAQGAGQMIDEKAHDQGDAGLEVCIWESHDQRKRLRWQKIMHGGHN